MRTRTHTHTPTPTQAVTGTDTGREKGDGERNFVTWFLWPIQGLLAMYFPNEKTMHYCLCKGSIKKFRLFHFHFHFQLSYFFSVE